MIVQFHRTGERQYHVVVIRQGSTPLVMKPAPGFDLWMPHDLQHFVVEKALQLNHGIFGQLAAGGTARTFHAVPAKSGKDAARARRQLQKRGDRLARAGEVDAAISERATFVFWSRWLLTQSDPVCVTKGRSMQATTQQILAGVSAEERDRYDAPTTARVIRALEEASQLWQNTAPGGFIQFSWFGPEKRGSVG